MSKLHLRLLIPLLFLAGVSFFVAKSLSSSLDYSAIFVNLTTDFIVVIITIYYVDSVLKAHENERWKSVDNSIINRIVSKIFVLIEQICTVFDLGALEREMYPKLYNPRGTSQLAVYLYFISEMSKKPTMDFEKRFMALPEADREKIINYAKNSASILSEIITLYGNRLPPEVLLKIVDAQEAVRLFVNETSVDGFSIYILLEYLADIVGTTRRERLEYYMPVDKKPQDELR